MASDEIDYQLIGDDLQAVIVTLDPEEAVVAEAGAMMYMQDGIRMMTSLDMQGRGGNKLMDRLFRPENACSPAIHFSSRSS